MFPVSIHLHFQHDLTTMLVRFSGCGHILCVLII
jgi:hypothetical protein